MGRELCDDIADDLSEVFTDVNDFGIVVTHTRRVGTTASISGTFTEGRQEPLKDSSQGRQIVRTGWLLVGSTDVNGSSYVLDDQGSFTVRGEVWSISNVATIAGGYQISLTTTSRKTMRHLPGNG